MRLTSSVVTPRSGAFAYGPLVEVLARRLGRSLTTRSLVDESSKRALLAELATRCGREALVDAGLDVAAESAHPFARALRAQRRPEEVLALWTRIEILGHAHNRVQLLDLSDSGIRLLRLRLGGKGPPPIEEDLFILGVLQGYLARIGLQDFRRDPPTSDQRGRLWRLRFRRDGFSAIPTVERIWCAEGETGRTVFAASTNLVTSGVPVDVATISRRLALSARTLQRRLALEGTSFSTLLRAARVAAAATSIAATRGSLTDVAHRFGFADSAHMSREFRELLGCSPRQFSRASRGAIGA